LASRPVTTLLAWVRRPASHGRAPDRRAGFARCRRSRKHTRQAIRPRTSETTNAARLSMTVPPHTAETITDDSAIDFRPPRRRELSPAGAIDSGRNRNGDRGGNRGSSSAPRYSTKPEWPRTSHGLAIHEHHRSPLACLSRGLSSSTVRIGLAIDLDDHVARADPGLVGAPPRRRRARDASLALRPSSRHRRREGCTERPACPCPRSRHLGRRSSRAGRSGGEPHLRPPRTTTSAPRFHLHLGDEARSRPTWQPSCQRIPRSLTGLHAGLLRRGASITERPAPLASRA